MKTNPTPLFIALAVFLSVGPRPLHAASETGTLKVAVFDENGNPASAAHVYIYGGNKRRLIDGQDVQGSTDFQLSPGRYRVYAAITKAGGGYIDHFASHEATVRLPANDRASVILTLQRVNDPVMYVPESALKQLHLDPNLEKNLN